MSVASPLLKIDVTNEVFHDWGTVPELNDVLKSIYKQGSRRCSGTWYIRIYRNQLASWPIGIA